jgi:hypothetical protein
MQIIDAGRTASEVQACIERPAVKHIVEVRYSGADWPDLLADMQSWLDRRQIEAEEIDCSTLGRGVAVRIGFGNEDHAAAFATAFSGRLEGSTLAKPAAGPVQDAVVRPTDEDASIAEDLTTSGEPLAESVRPAAKTGVSLMITRQQKADLRERGYTDEQIRDMKPEEAHRVLGLIAQQPPSASAGRRRSPG